MRALVPKQCVHCMPFLNIELSRAVKLSFLFWYAPLELAYNVNLLRNVTTCLEIATTYFEIMAF